MSINQKVIFRPKRLERAIDTNEYYIEKRKKHNIVNGIL